MTTTLENSIPITSYDMEKLKAHFELMTQKITGEIMDDDFEVDDEVIQKFLREFCNIGFFTLKEREDTSETKPKKKKPTKRRGPSAYNRYLASKPKDEDIKAFRAKWKFMTPEEQKPFHEEAKALKDKVASDSEEKKEDSQQTQNKSSKKSSKKSSEKSSTGAKKSSKKKNTDPLTPIIPQLTEDEQNFNGLSKPIINQCLADKKGKSYVSLEEAYTAALALDGCSGITRNNKGKYTLRLGGHDSLKPVEIKYQPEVSWLINTQTTAHAQPVEEDQQNHDDDLQNTHENGDEDGLDDHDDDDSEEDDSEDDDSDEDED